MPAKRCGIKIGIRANGAPPAKYFVAPENVSEQAGSKKLSPKQDKVIFEGLPKILVNRAYNQSWNNVPNIKKSSDRTSSLQSSRIKSF